MCVIVPTGNEVNVHSFAEEQRGTLMSLLS